MSTMRSIFGILLIVVGIALIFEDVLYLLASGMPTDGLSSTRSDGGAASFLLFLGPAALIAGVFIIRAGRRKGNKEPLSPAGAATRSDETDTR